MTARITATVPDYVADGIKRLSIRQGQEPSNTAAFILEQAIIEAIKSNIIPSKELVSSELLADTNLIAKKQGVDSAEVMFFLLSRAIAEGIGEENIRSR